MLYFVHIGWNSNYHWSTTKWHYKIYHIGSKDVNSMLTLQIMTTNYPITPEKDDSIISWSQVDFRELGYSIFKWTGKWKYEKYVNFYCLIGYQIQWCSILRYIVNMKLDGNFPTSDIFV